GVVPQRVAEIAQALCGEFARRDARVELRERRVRPRAAVVDRREDLPREERGESGRDGRERAPPALTEEYQRERGGHEQERVHPVERQQAGQERDAEDAAVVPRLFFENAEREQRQQEMGQ